jgi:predicted phosphodiesterase
MRILAISDIHNNVACIRKLRSQESNQFDVVAIAGDIGGHRAAEIFAVLRTSMEIGIASLRIGSDSVRGAISHI